MASLTAGLSSTASTLHQKIQQTQHEKLVHNFDVMFLHIPFPTAGKVLNLVHCLKQYMIEQLYGYLISCQQ